MRNNILRDPKPGGHHSDPPRGGHHQDPGGGGSKRDPKPGSDWLAWISCLIDPGGGGRQWGIK